MTEVHEADEGDVEALVTLMGEFYAESSLPFDAEAARGAFVRVVREPHLGALLLAERDGAIAGYLALTFTFTFEHFGLSAFVDDLFVRAAHRRAGVGERLLDEAERECRRRDVQALHLECGSDNEPALGLYRKRGLAPTGRLLLTKRLA